MASIRITAEYFDFHGCQKGFQGSVELFNLSEYPSFSLELRDTKPERCFSVSVTEDGAREGKHNLDDSDTVYVV